MHINITLMILTLLTGLLPVHAGGAPLTGDPVVIIAAVVVLSVVAMVVLSVLSKRGGGRGGKRR